MTDTKLEPELPQATFFITGEIGKPMIPAYTAEQVRAAIEADRNKRAPVGGLTDEQIVAAAHNADGIGRVSLTLINNDGAEVPTFVAKQFARALLSSVAPRASEGYVIVPVTLIEWAQQNIDNVEDEDERKRISASLGDYIAAAIPTTAELPAT